MSPQPYVHGPFGSGTQGFQLQLANMVYRGEILPALLLSLGINPAGGLGAGPTIKQALGNLKFPSSKELASRLGITEEKFHHDIKAALKVDFKELRNVKNFDVGIDKAGNIAFKDRFTGRTIQTDVPLNSYGRFGE